MVGKIPLEFRPKRFLIALEDKDLIGLSQMGSGKTGAFCSSDITSPFGCSKTKCVLCLCAVSNKLVGGVDMTAQAISLAKRPHIIVATSGRLMDHLTNTKVQKLQRACLRNPVKIEAASKHSTVDTLQQKFLFVPDDHKDCFLVHTLIQRPTSMSMISTRTCDKTCSLAVVLSNLGLKVVPIYGHMSQAKRLGALNLFKSGQYNIIRAV